MSQSMETLDRDAEFELKLEQELVQGRPYEAFQFASSYLARKFSPSTALIVRNRLLQAVELFMRLHCPEQAGHLLVWYLEQAAYITELSESDLSNCMSTMCGILQDNDPSESGVLADITANNIVKIITGDRSKERCKQSNRVSPFAASAVITALGDALGRVGKWEQATKLFARNTDMKKVASALHNWAQSGNYQSEYPLYFARMVLKLLSNKRATDAASLVQNSADFMKTFAPMFPPGQKESNALNIPVWHFCVMLCDLIGLGSTISAKEKIDIYSILQKKYAPALRHSDLELEAMANKVSAHFKLQKIPPSAGASGVPSLLRRHTY